MKGIVIAFSLLLSACSVQPEQSAASRVRSFYESYLATLASSDFEYPQSQLREYVSADTLSRLDQIDVIPEQDLLGSDYFAYVQDYDPSWVGALTIGSVRSFLNGEVMPVWIGINDGKKVELEVYVRREAGEWKIYRVRDVTDNYEHPIFNAGRISQAKADAESGR